VRRLAALKPALDRLYATFNHPQAAADPVHLVRRYDRRDDREIAGFLASALAFGRVAGVLQSVERVLAIAGPHPAAFAASFDPARQARRFAGLVHRWIRAADVVALFTVLRRMLEQSGSIEGFFLEGDDGSSADVGPALDSFSRRALACAPRGAAGVRYFFPSPSAGSGCKRLNLYLRWMVRRDGIDLGVWSRVHPSRLVVPLDTHVVRVGRCLGLTRYTSPGWPMARDITAGLRRLDPDDPVKYDFALCHLGMMEACGFSRPQGDVQCPLRGACRPRVRRRRRSRPPFARP
jgi:uncharacterized protein (TIGR02757 family)